MPDNSKQTKPQNVCLIIDSPRSYSKCPQRWMCGTIIMVVMTLTDYYWVTLLIWLFVGSFTLQSQDDIQLQRTS